jgi:hypothetical protein
VVDGGELKKCIGEIRKTTTVRLWAEKNGFKYQTVIKVLHGYAGKRQIGVAAEIVDALNRDGFLNTENPKQAA